MESSDLSDKEFKIIVIKMYYKLGRRMDDHSVTSKRVRKY